MQKLELDRVAALRVAYDELYYTGEKHDSPERSRTQMIRSITDWLKQTDIVSPTIIDLGSGPQMLEKQLVAQVRSQPNHALRSKLLTTKIITLDVAHTHRLYAPNYAHHVRADSRLLPIKSAMADMVISNHSIDMLRAEEGQFEMALGEVRRVLKPNGSILFNYHPADLHEYCVNRYGSHTDTPHGVFYSRDSSNPYYESAAQIESDLDQSNLVTDSINYVSRDFDSWWQVAAHKTSN